MRLAALCCLLLLAGGSVFAAEQAKPPAVPITIEADAVESNTDLTTARATGHAVLTYGTIVLNADEITANRATGDVAASGHLVIRQPGRKLTGDRATANMNANSGSLVNARVVDQGIIVRGERLDFSPQQVVAYHASFTTCTATPPDYRLQADRITLTAPPTTPPGQVPTGGRLTLTKARLYYHKRRVVTLPNYSVAVGQIQQHKASVVPTSGFSRDDGAYTAIGRTFGKQGGRTQGSLNLRLTTNRGLRGVLEVHQTRGPRELFANYTRREDPGEAPIEGDQLTFGTAKVLVNREPEVGVRVTQLPFRRKLTLAGDLTAGRYSEMNSDSRTVLARANRISATAIVASAARPLRPNLSLHYAVGARESVYSTGGALTLGYLRLTTEHVRGEDHRLSLSYIRRVSAGSSPFVFDRVDIADELQVALRQRVNPAWRVAITERYDLERREVRDMEVSATRTAHCLEYTVGWRKLRGNFFIGINLAPMSPAELAAQLADP